MISTPPARLRRDPGIRDQFSGHLLADETVLWAACGKAPAGGPFAILFPIILGVIALGIGGEIILQSTYLSASAILLLAVFGYIFWKIASFTDSAQRYYYAVTDHRVLIVRRFLGESVVTTFTPNDIQFRIKLHRTDGRGSLFFGREIEEVDRIAGKFFKLKNIGFVQIPEVAAAEQAIEALLGHPQPIASTVAPNNAETPPLEGTRSLSPHLRNELLAELRPGEKILWLECPSEPSYLKLAKAAADLIGIFILILFAFTWTLAAFLIGKFVFGILGGIAAAILVEVFVSWGIKYIWNTRERGIVYLVTNMRALKLISRGGEREIWSALPSEIHIRARHVRADRSGDVFFLYEVAKDPKKGIVREREAGFEHVPNVYAAERALIALKQSN